MTSPIAYSQSLARIESSTSTGLPGSRPTLSSPMSSVLSLRPMATSSSSARTGPPSSSSRVTSPPSARTAVALVPRRTSTPFSRSDCSTSSLANRSSRGIRRSPRSISVTSDPSELYACAISTPTTPPPRIASRPGTSFAVVASRLVHGFASRKPSIGGISGELPVATTTALRAMSVSSPARTRRSPSRRPGARTTATFRFSSQGTWLESSSPWMISSRRFRTASTSRSPVTASRTPGMRRTSASSSPGRSSPLDGMHA